MLVYLSYLFILQRTVHCQLYDLVLAFHLLELDLLLLLC